jgi:hypothetical protein
MKEVTSPLVEIDGRGHDRCYAIAVSADPMT